MSILLDLGAQAGGREGRKEGESGIFCRGWRGGGRSFREFGWSWLGRWKTKEGRNKEESSKARHFDSVLPLRLSDLAGLRSASSSGSGDEQSYTDIKSRECTAYKVLGWRMRFDLRR